MDCIGEVAVPAELHDDAETPKRLVKKRCEIANYVVVAQFHENVCLAPRTHWPPDSDHGAESLKVPRIEMGGGTSIDWKVGVFGTRQTRQPWDTFLPEGTEIGVRHRGAFAPGSPPLFLYRYSASQVLVWKVHLKIKI